MKELDYIHVGGSYGGYQDWFDDWWMKIGGCAAVAACDTCMFLQQKMGVKGIYPFDERRITKEDFLRFGMIMKTYLRPRIGGIAKLSIYTEGFGRYLKERGITSLHMDTLDGEAPLWLARDAIMHQINRNLPIPVLTLKHDHPKMKYLTWHWYLIIGYKSIGSKLVVKTLTYNTVRWIDLDVLWNTGHKRKGGLILYHLDRG